MEQNHQDHDTTKINQGDENNDIKDPWVVTIKLSTLRNIIIGSLTSLFVGGGITYKVSQDSHSSSGYLDMIDFQQAQSLLGELNATQQSYYSISNQIINSPELDDYDKWFKLSNLNNNIHNQLLNTETKILQTERMTRNIIQMTE